MRTVTAAGIDLIVVELCDRQGLGNPLREWCFQSELENYLYSSWQTLLTYLLTYLLRTFTVRRERTWPRG